MGAARGALAMPSAGLVETANICKKAMRRGIEVRGGVSDPVGESIDVDRTFERTLDFVHRPFYHGDFRRLPSRQVGRSWPRMTFFPSRDGSARSSHGGRSVASSGRRHRLSGGVPKNPSIGKCSFFRLLCERVTSINRHFELREQLLKESQRHPTSESRHCR